MKQLLYLAMLALISVSLASSAREADEENVIDRVQVSTTMGALDSVLYNYPLYECILLKERETNVDVYVRKGEKLDPEGIIAYGNTFLVNIVDETHYPFAKRRCCIVILKETVDHVGGSIVRTWDRAIRVRYHYEK